MPVSIASFTRALEAVAPFSWAEEWDNVGLLIRPPRRARVSRVLLTIDLTDAVVAEARRARVDGIVAYHPPIFAPLTRMVPEDPKARVVMDCLAARVAVWSPHTALDAAEDGVNDWLADAVGDGRRQPWVRGAQHADAPGSVGQGRGVELARPVSFQTIVKRVKAHLGMKHVRTAVAPAHLRGKVSTVAVCAGAGGSVLAARSADVYLTGEMRHHDVLAAIDRGTSVILCEHTNTERGFLPRLARRLEGAGVELVIAKTDADPLVVS